MSEAFLTEAKCTADLYHTEHSSIQFHSIDRRVDEIAAAIDIECDNCPPLLQWALMIMVLILSCGGGSTPLLNYAL